jgi:4-hydroxy-tetrahydrodipicolinate reductase
VADERRRPLRVIQWGTGNAGRKALAGILRHPELELVGVHAHSPAKVGKDAAELCGSGAPTGIRATNDAAALLALDADCVCYTAQGETRIRETIDELCRILASGKNVVNTAIVSLCYPAASPKLRDRLAEACAKGGSTFFTSGFDPGWSGDVIPLQLASCCERVDSVRVSELMDYSTYPDPGFTGVYFGYGRPLDYQAPLLQPGMLKGGWGCMVLMVADALGVRLDELREEHERLPAPETFETAMGKIERGTCAAVRFEVQGIVNGKPMIMAIPVQKVGNCCPVSSWRRCAQRRTKKVALHCRIIKVRMIESNRIRAEETVEINQTVTGRSIKQIRAAAFFQIDHDLEAIEQHVLGNDVECVRWISRTGFFARTEAA